jgi:hypothetical protein
VPPVRWLRGWPRAAGDQRVCARSGARRGRRTRRPGGCTDGARRHGRRHRPGTRDALRRAAAVDVEARGLVGRERDRSRRSLTICGTSCSAPCRPLPAKPTRCVGPRLPRPPSSAPPATSGR